MADTSAISPLSGGYLLIVLTEPHSEQHKQVLLERLAKGQFVVVIRFFLLLSLREQQNQQNGGVGCNCAAVRQSFRGVVFPLRCVPSSSSCFFPEKRERDPSPQYPSRPVGRGYNHRRRVTLG